MSTLDGLSPASAEYWLRGRELVEEARDEVAASNAGIKRRAKEAEKLAERREAVLRKISRDTEELSAAVGDAYRFRDEARSYAAYLRSRYGVDGTSVEPCHRLNARELAVLDDGICDYLAG